jgi:hypothetical protein
VGRPNNTKDIKQEKKRKTEPKGIQLGETLESWEFLNRINRWIRNSWSEQNENFIDEKGAKQINILTAMAFRGLTYTDNLNDEIIKEAVEKMQVSMERGGSVLTKKLCGVISGAMSMNDLYGAICKMGD